MSDTIWVQVRGRADDEPQDCSIALKLSDSLDRIARKLGVTPPSEFHDHSDVAVALGDEFDLPADAHEENWSDATVGLASVTAILDYLDAHPDAIRFTPNRGRDHWPAMLMEELGHAEDRLRAAAAEGGQFRFLIVM